METSPAQRRPGWRAIAATVLLGWLMALSPLGNPLSRMSFDLLQVLLPSHGTNAPVIIYMDEQAMQDYGQRPREWDRSLHAGLLDRLTLDQPRVVVFDVIFSQTNQSHADQDLARALRENGRVVLAGDRVPGPGGGYTLVPPLELFETNAAAWGTAKIHRDGDLAVRRYDDGDDQRAGLAWAAAEVAGAKVTESPDRRLGESRWLNYYGSG
ncbi:MAG TPA: CHASE2 domain-containing protein, partial [Verrucomicrobiae bacterium]|nr:CHASE2 domain-containing protein [Verrucomicrobiae bacterium]